MKKVNCYLLLLLLSSIFSSCEKSAAPDSSKSLPREGFNYETKGVFTLGVSDDIYSVQEFKDAVSRLGEDLETISDMMSPNVKERIADDTVWIYKGEQTAVFNPIGSRGVFAGAIAIEDIGKFDETKSANQPMLLMNLVARLYHDKYMTDIERTALKDAHSSIGSKYDKVYYSTGKKLEKDKKKSPAKDSEQDYFAELSEAYFGTNDYYPMDIEELERFDAEGYALMESVWGKRTLEPNKYNITMPPVSLKQWKLGIESNLDMHYRKYMDAGGIPLVASRFVDNEAMKQAAYIMKEMTSAIPKEAIKKIIDKHVRIGLVGRYENITDMPECRDWNTRWPSTNWDTRGRGYGATDDFPIMTCGEENIVKITEYKEMYPTESIMVHEFAHVVYYGLHKVTGEKFSADIAAAFENANTKGYWKTVAGDKTYSLENSDEYFAEGVQAWFNTCRMVVNIDGKDTKLKTREQLQAHDPELYEVISRYMPSGHLTGYHFDYE